MVNSYCKDVGMGKVVEFMKDMENLGIEPISDLAKFDQWVC